MSRQSNIASVLSRDMSFSVETIPMGCNYQNIEFKEIYFHKYIYIYSALSICRCHIIHRPHPKNRPRLSRDNKIDDISLNTHTNRFKCKPHITIMYIHTCVIKSTSNYALK